MQGLNLAAVGAWGLWGDGRELLEFVALRSYPGCQAQGKHCDYDPTELARHPDSLVPWSVLWALQPDTKLMLYGRNGTTIELAVPIGKLLVFRGDLVHAGAKYKKQNVRVHCYVNATKGGQIANATQMRRKCNANATYSQQEHFFVPRAPPAGVPPPAQADDAPPPPPPPPPLSDDGPLRCPRGHRPIKSLAGDARGRGRCDGCAEQVCFGDKIASCTQLSRTHEGFDCNFYLCQACLHEAENPSPGSAVSAAAAAGSGPSGLHFMAGQGGCMCPMHAVHNTIGTNEANGLVVGDFHVPRGEQLLDDNVELAPPAYHTNFATLALTHRSHSASLRVARAATASTILWSPAPPTITLALVHAPSLR